MTQQIPGDFITSSGGIVQITPAGGQWGSPLNRTPEFGTPSATSYPPGFGGASQGNTLDLDCFGWQIQKHPFYDDSTNTGSYGAQGTEVTAEGWSATVDLMVNQSAPPDMLVRYGLYAGRGAAVQSLGNSQFGFNLGVRAIFIMGAGYNYPSDFALDFYWCPSAKIGPCIPVIDANNKKMVRMSVSLTGNARMFKMPAEANLANDYINHLATRGQGF